MNAARVDWVVAEPVIASIAADAASRTPGVLRLQPGLAGLVGSVGRMARQRVRGLSSAPREGVTVELTDGAADIHLYLTLAGFAPAQQLAAAVQRAVAGAVHEDTGVVVRSVAITIIDIDTEDDELDQQGVR
ncbi:putative alkaline shock family protein YloU [Tamaricihabitans halophyticus]|uniref:Putative alkaline shock family protein YloU n=1 Tax=Tamaricihabitans halophyticus TaxID=1262583 RepID=A0A4R2RBW4_9PSEU|nr:Asp23/Gls24 family envelope stress response protein [Tamaricihabitans halophyticus]TCP56915.1 putative alkaline shock family protein YloU [Tamaricihabitans halophyticus]